MDVLLDGIWRSFKKDLARDMPAGQAESLDQFSLEDALSGDTVMRKMAEDNFGPLLASMGVEEDPLTFFIDLVKVATCVQLITCAVVFYGAELGLHLDAGAALRATAGLGLGYFSRIFIKIERLVWPAYNWLLKLLVANAVYEVEATSAEDQQRTLNTLGVLVAVSFLVPQYALGWEPSDCLQLVWPLLLGLFGFDLTYMLALMLKLRLI